MLGPRFDPNDFDDLGDSYQDDAITPPWYIDRSKDENIVKWTHDAFRARREATAQQRWEAHAGTAAWRGYYYYRSGAAHTAESWDRQKNTIRWPRIGINQSRILVEQKIAKTNNITHQIAIVPANSEPKDKIASIQAKKVIDTLDYHYNMKLLRTRMLRRASLWSQSYLYINWNEDIGDPVPEFENKKKSGPIFLLDEDSNPVLDAEGNKIELKEAPRIGDVELGLLNFDNVDLLFIPTIFGPMPYGCIITKPVHYLELKHDYPEWKNHIEPVGQGVEWWSEDILDYKVLKDHILQHEVYIRSMRFLPNGAYWKCTSGGVDKDGSGILLEKFQDNPIPYTRALEASELGNLPIEMLKDLDVEGHFYGDKSLNDIFPIQRAYDKLFSLIMRNIWTFAHPKIVTPRNGVNLENLSSGALVIQSSGPFQPFMLNPQVINQDIMNLFVGMPSLMGTLYSVFEQSMGKAPKGARSAQQLMIYDEQEEEARGTIRAKLESFAVGVAAKELALVSKFYKKEDKRLYRVLGENKEWVSNFFDVEDLQKDYVVRVIASTLFSDDKSKRVNTLLQLKQILGPELPTAQFLEAIDFGQHDRVIEMGRTSVLAAQLENELFKAGRGEEVLPPQPYEDLLTHWTEHSIMFYDASFKLLPKEDQKVASEHQLGTEYLIYGQMARNPAFRQKVLSSLINFPMFYVEPEIEAATQIPTDGVAQSPMPQQSPAPIAQQQMGQPQ